MLICFGQLAVAITRPSGENPTEKLSFLCRLSSATCGMPHKVIYRYDFVFWLFPERRTGLTDIVLCLYYQHRTNSRERRLNAV